MRYYHNMNILIEQLKAFIDPKLPLMSNLSNASAILNQLDNINWCGFYIYENEKLILGPFQGKPACEIISITKGVCGYCARNMKTIVVDNVHDFPGHIACDCESNSEIVLPIIIDNKLFGVLDIDSKKLKRFNEEDKFVLENVVKTLESVIKESKKIDGIL